MALNNFSQHFNNIFVSHLSYVNTIRDQRKQMILGMLKDMTFISSKLGKFCFVIYNPFVYLFCLVHMRLDIPFID